MDGRPAISDTALNFLRQGWELAESWLLSPAAWSQFALLLVAWFLAVLIAIRVMPVATRLIAPTDDAEGPVTEVRRFILPFLALLLPLLAYALTGLGEQVTRSLFGSGEVIAFGKRVFLFLAARALVRDMLTDAFLKLMGRFILMPVAGLHAVGLLDAVSQILAETNVGIGNISFSVLAVLRALVVGAILFWVAQWTRGQSASYIEKQELRPAIRELAVKSAEIAIFGMAFLMLMNILGIDLTTLAVLGGAVGVGLGFGLQKVASNFISGIILLIEGQTTVGDYVELDGGESGTIVKMTARAAILQTFDGRWIVVPNEDFITTRVVNFSDSGSANRYEAEFSVSYNTDINLVPGIVEKAVAKHKDVLSDPFPPDCELRGFGDSGVEFAVEFWVNGIDDGPNKYSSGVRFLIWNALLDAGIEIPYPQRVLHLRDGSVT